MSFSIVNPSYLVNTNNITELESAGSSIISKDRIYQQLNSYSSSVNGYYGLAKDAYPALNPISFGEKLVSSWEISPLDTSANLWQGSVWSPELELFVAVGSDGTLNNVMTSRNGINWTYGTTPDSKIYRSITWSPQLNLFVAVSSDSSSSTQRVMTSSNGITWTLQTTPDKLWWNVCWSAELGIFVAVARYNVSFGSGNLVMTSTNGTTWTSQTSPADYNWSAVVWSPQLSLFVAVANTGGGNNVMTSPNGLNWTLRSCPSNSWNTLTWSPQLGLFVAMAASGAVDANNKAMTSPDGINWTARSTANSPFQLNYGQVIWIAEIGLFVAAAPGTTGSGNKYVAYSSNGINWLFTSPLPNGNSYANISWSPELSMLVMTAAFPATDVNKALYIALRNRLPTSYNVFDSSFNNIDSSGNWTLKSKRIFSDGNITIDPSNNLIVLGDVSAGVLTKGSGSFKIDHPLPEKSETHHLVHSFIEGPRADLIYRGRVELVNGEAYVNIDDSTGMTEGTFVALCRDIQCFTSNDTNWDQVKGKVTGNQLHITCQNPQSIATVSWIVIGERQDKHMYDTEWTDSNGRVIVEPLKR